MSLQRLIDAAGNRAAEGLRTLEDLARFVLDDQEVTATLKTMRHDLGNLVGRMADARAWHRDTPSDVGTTISTDEEGRRDAPGDVAAAATARATQAIRTLEEIGKLAEPDVASSFESMRYAIYDLGARLERRLGTPTRQWSLCLLLTVEACRAPWAEVLAASLQGGVDCVQVREKHMSDAMLVEHVRSVVQACDGHGVPVIVNDRVDIALAGGAAGVHLGDDDLPVSEARRLCGRRLIIGVTTHGPRDAAAAVDAGADYVGIGPMFASETKPGLDPGGIARLRLTLPVIGAMPHLAIGGITPATIDEVRAAGARGVAVSRALCAAACPRTTARTLCEGLAVTHDA